MTNYAEEQQNALDELRAAGTQFDVLDGTGAYDPVSGTTNASNAVLVSSFGILTTPGQFDRVADAELTEMITHKALIAGLPFENAGVRLSTSHLLRVVGQTYRVLGIGEVALDGPVILYKPVLGRI